MANDWAPEPWVQANNDDDSIIFDAEKHKLVHQDAGYYAATHARIVACVNACAGVPMEILQLKQAVSDKLESYESALYGLSESAYKVASGCYADDLGVARTCATLAQEIRDYLLTLPGTYKEATDGHDDTVSSD